jgi:hypothetical protein
MYMNNTDNPTLHLDTNKCKETKLWLRFYVNSHSRVFSNDQEKKGKDTHTHTYIMYMCDILYKYCIIYDIKNH